MLPDRKISLTLSIASDPSRKRLVEEFMALYPNVTIELQQTPFSSYQMSLKLALASDNPPDIVQFSPGAMRSIIPAGLVLPLNPYEEAYGWGARISESLLDITRTTPDAKQYGTGNLYATPVGVQTLGVFYNKKMISEAGIAQAPSTLRQLEADFATLKRAGQTPLSLGAFQVSAFQLWGGLANVMGDPQAYVDWVHGKPGSSIDTEAAVQAADKVREWVAKKYTLPQPNAIPDAQAIADFSSGKTAYVLGRNANAAGLMAGMGETNLGFFYLPPLNEADPAVTTGTSLPFAVSSKSENADAAAFFLNYLTTSKAAGAAYEAGFIPMSPIEEDAKAPGLRGAMLSAYEKALAGAGVSPFANFATASMLDTLTSGMQGVVAGKMSGKEFVASLQADWSQVHGG